MENELQFDPNFKPELFNCRTLKFADAIRAEHDSFVMDRLLQQAHEILRNEH